METDQAEHLNAVLNQPIRTFNKNQEAEESAASTTIMVIVMAEKKDTDVISETHKPNVTIESKFTVYSQKMAQRSNLN